MNTSVDLNDIMLAAVLEHHRTHHASEWYYLNCLRRKSEIDPDALSLMLNEFGLSRNLIGNGEGLKTLVEVLKNNKEQFSDKIDWSTAFKAAEGLKTPNKRRFISGMTKVLWFVFGHNQPMFDTYTRAAVRPKGRDTLEMAKNFMTTFEDKHYKNLHEEMSKTINGAELPWTASPERIIDKALMIKGAQNIQKRKQKKNGEAPDAFGPIVFFRLLENRDTYLKNFPQPCKLKKLSVDLSKQVKENSVLMEFLSR